MMNLEKDLIEEQHIFEKMKKLYDAGLSYKEIGEEFGMTSNEVMLNYGPYLMDEEELNNILDEYEKESD